MATPPYNISVNIPLSSDILNQYPTQSTNFRDIVSSWLNQISDPTTGNMRDLVMDVRTTAPAVPAVDDEKMYFRDYGGEFPVLEWQGNDGTVINAASVGQVSGVDDLFINGDFRIWQRTKVWGATSLLMNSGTYQYVADRWLSFRSGGTQTVSQQAFTLGQTDVPGEPKFFMRIARTVAGTSDSFIFAQPVDDVRKLPGRFVTVSAWVRSSVTKTYRWNLAQFFGSGGSSAVTALGPEVDLVANVWTRITWSGVIAPSISGKAAAIAGTGTNIGLSELTGSYTTFTLDVAEASLRYGDWSSFSTPPARRSYDEEFRLAQYYYRVYGGTFAAEILPGKGSMYNTTLGFFLLNLGARMRVDPAWSIPTLADWKMVGAGATPLLNNATKSATEQGPEVFMLNLTPATPIAAGAGFWVGSANANARLILDAEL